MKTVVSRVAVEDRNKSSCHYENMVMRELEHLQRKMDNRNILNTCAMLHYAQVQYSKNSAHFKTKSLLKSSDGTVPDNILFWTYLHQL